MAFSQAETDSQSTLIGIMMTLLGLVSSGVTNVRQSLFSAHNSYARSSGKAMLPNPDDSMGIVREARMFGAAVVTIAITVIVVNEVLTVDTINNTTGPFTGVIEDLETTGVAAMGLLVVGLLVVAGRVVMGFMGGGGGGGF
jgi:hypothetical protein